MAGGEVFPPEKSLVPTEDERTWGLLAHLSCFIAGLVGLPFLGPLVVLFAKKDQSAFVEEHAREALNFQIAVIVAALVCGATCVGIILLPVVLIGAIVYPILGALEANKGNSYRYPYSIRFINK